MNTKTTALPAIGQSFAPQTMDEAIRFAEILASSSIVPKEYQGSPGNVLVAVQWGMEIGLQPLQAMQNIAVINGRPSIWGDAALALVRGSGQLEQIVEECDGQTATCTVTRRGELPTVRSFTMEEAKRAGLAGKQGPWTQYPRRMLQLRARAFALRDVFPDVLRGIGIAEEERDRPEAAQDAERDMGAAEVVCAAGAQKTSRTEALKSRLARAKKTPAPQQLENTAQDATAPAVTLDSVLSAIASAKDMQALELVTEQALQLASDEDKGKAREVFKARKKQLQDVAAIEAALDAPAIVEGGDER